MAFVYVPADLAISEAESEAVNSAHDERRPTSSVRVVHERLSLLSGSRVSG